MESKSQTRSMPKAEADELAEADAVRASANERTSDVIEDVDELLAEIDSILEEQSVLTNFRQKGGE
jgi:hypothetical protein